MKKICLLIPLLTALIVVVACSTATHYDKNEAAALVSKIQNGDSLSTADYLAMIDQARSGLEVFDASLDTMNIKSRAGYDSAMQELAGNEAFVKMINDCLLFERVLRDAPLDKEAQDKYKKFLNQQVEFKNKYLK